MSDEEFSLDCDDFSIISSLSSDDMMKPEIYDLLSVGDQSSAGKYEARCQMELEGMIANFNFNHQSISQLRSFGAFHQSSTTGTLSAFEVFTVETLTQSDEYTFETIRTDDVTIAVSVMDCESMSYEVHGEEKLEEDCQDHEASEDDGNSSRRSRLDEAEDISGHSQQPQSELLSKNTDGDVSNGIANTNYHYVENERIQRARARRFEALKRYQDVLHSTSTHSSIHQEASSLTQMTDENVDPSSSLAPLIFRSQQISLSPDTRRMSINALRSRQRKSMQDLISAFDKVRRKDKADSTTPRQTRQPRVRKLWSLSPAGRWNKR